MAVSIVAPSAEARTLVPGGTYGNLKVARGSVTFAAAAQNVTAGVIRVPAHSVISRVFGSNAALGVNSVLEIGIQAVADAAVIDTDAFADVADGNVAGIFDSGGDATSVTGVASGLAITEDSYITVKNTGAGAATGLVNVIVEYEYVGI